MSTQYENQHPRVLGTPRTIYLNVTGMNMKGVRKKIRQFADLFEVDFRDIAINIEGYWTIKHDEDTLKFIPRHTAVSHLSHQTFYTGTNRLRPLPASQKMNGASLVSILVLYWAKGKAPTWKLSKSELNYLERRGYLIPELDPHT